LPQILILVIKICSLKIIGKRHWKNFRVRKAPNSRSFLPINFFTENLFKPISTNLEWTLILLFLVYPTHIDLVEKIFSDVMEAFFCTFWIKMLKKRKIFKQFAKSENLLFCQVIILRLEPIEIIETYKNFVPLLSVGAYYNGPKNWQTLMLGVRVCPQHGPVACNKVSKNWQTLMPGVCLCVHNMDRVPTTRSLRIGKLQC
jgi:hypothetical protein